VRTNVVAPFGHETVAALAVELVTVHEEDDVEKKARGAGIS
jgi:hypothetical protein